MSVLEAIIFSITVILIIASTIFYIVWACEYRGKGQEYFEKRFGYQDYAFMRGVSIVLAIIACIVLVTLIIIGMIYTSLAVYILGVLIILVVLFGLSIPIRKTIKILKRTKNDKKIREEEERRAQRRAEMESTKPTQKFIVHGD